MTDHPDGLGHLTAMILSTILGMIHRHDRRNQSCTMLGMITRTIFWTFRTITTTTHWHYPGDDPRQPSEISTAMITRTIPEPITTTVRRAPSP